MDGKILFEMNMKFVTSIGELWILLDFIVLHDGLIIRDQEALDNWSSTYERNEDCSWTTPPIADFTKFRCLNECVSSGQLCWHSTVDNLTFNHFSILVSYLTRLNLTNHGLCHSCELVMQDCEIFHLRSG